MLYRDEMVEKILEILKQGTKTEIVLNMFIYADFSRWKQDYIKEFIEFIKQFVESKEPNLMYKCYNPILTICLSCEFLTKIGNAIAFFKNEVNNLISQLLTLGEKLIENMNSNVVSIIFMDTDFLDRTVLKLITDYEYEPLMRDDKVSALLDELWFGKDTYECDGRLTDYSMLTTLVSAPIKKFNLSSLFNFKAFIEEENFTFQYKFRTRSIAFIFKKELLSTIVIWSSMIIINVKYLLNFSIPNNF